MDAPGLIELDTANERIPFSQQWERQKPLLEKLYLDEGLNLPKIRKIMREENSFDAE
jgi:hypothetical protein